MSKVKISDSICNISERNFWSSMKAPRGDEVLAEAIRLGLRGEKAPAYRKLGEHHRVRLASERKFQREQMLKNQPKTLQKPEDLLRNRITTWHTTVADFGSEIDWNFANTDQYGFHYLFWLDPGTRRLMEKGEKEYRKCLMDIVTSYYRARNSLNHPIPGWHLIFYELGSWAKTRVLLPLYLELLAGGDLPVETHEAFMKLFLGFARSLYEMENVFRTGNWQCVGCGALLTLARVFPEFPEGRRWEERAVRFLKAHFKDDFFPDGCHKERCWGYGFMSLEGIADAYLVARRHGGLGKDEPFFLRSIRNGFRWFAKTLGPTEHKPSYGDDELHRGSMLDAARHFFPESAPRRLGVDASKSLLLNTSGFAIMRNGDAPASLYMNLNFGRFAGWHSHMDLFNLNLWAYGEPLLEEMARFGGYGEGLSLLCRAPESHNQLTIDGMHYDNTSDLIPGKNSPKIKGCGWEHPSFAHLAGRDIVWRSTLDADFFSAWHGAYRANWREPQSVTVRIRRTVVFVKDPGYVLVSDVAWETASNNEGPNLAVTQNWHSTQPFEILRPGMARTTRNGAACLLAFAPEQSLRRLETGVDFTATEAPGEREYPERYHLRARRWMPVEHRGATGMTVLLLPFKGKAPKISIEILDLKGAPLFKAGAFAVETPCGRDVIVLNPEHLCGLSFDGRPVAGRAMIRMERGGRSKAIRL